MSLAVPSPDGARPRRPALMRAAGALGLVLAAGLALLAVAGPKVRPARPEPPRLLVLPGFQLVERSGRPLTLGDLRGRPWVASFIFTRCAGICPAMTARMARLRKDLPEEVRSVTFTVDPSHDTPERLARYAEGFGAGRGWLFVTGEQEALHHLSVSGFKLAAMENPPGQPGADGPFLHSSKFVLVDAEATVRGYYDSADEEAMGALLADARAIGTLP